MVSYHHVILNEFWSTRRSTKIIAVRSLEKLRSPHRTAPRFGVREIFKPHLKIWSFFFVFFFNGNSQRGDPFHKSYSDSLSSETFSYDSDFISTGSLQLQESLSAQTICARVSVTVRAIVCAIRQVSTLSRAFRSRRLFVLPLQRRPDVCTTEIKSL